jgi:hypothetical protein
VFNTFKPIEHPRQAGSILFCNPNRANTQPFCIFDPVGPPMAPHLLNRESECGFQVEQGYFGKPTDSKKEKAMKAMMSVLFVMIMGLALVSSGEAGTGLSYNDNPGAICAVHKTPAGAVTKDADRAGSGMEEINSPCALSAPAAYTDFIDAREVPAAANTKRTRAPEAMGSWE